MIAYSEQEQFSFFVYGLRKDGTRLKALHSVPENTSLLHYLNETYGLKLDDIHLHRDMIGAVYFLGQQDRRFVYKLYRVFDAQAAIQSTEIMSYLKSHDFPVPDIIPTRQNQLCSSFKLAEGRRMGVLFEYIDGQETNLHTDICEIGQLTARMHTLMQTYPGDLRILDKGFYIDRFIGHMRHLNWDAGKIAEMDEYGKVLWDRLLSLPQGFTHGDLHTGNLLKTASGKIVVVDFDISAYSHPVFDIATICDDTNFVELERKDLKKTRENFRRFYAAYSKERQLTQAEQDVILDCITIHHYELLGTIPIYRMPVEGNHWMNERFFDLHYRWVMGMKRVRA